MEESAQVLRIRTSPSGLSRKRAGGFTLFEMLVALAVTAIAITGGLTLLMSSLTVSQMSRHISVATALAEERLTDLKNNPGQYNWSGLAIAAPNEWIELDKEPGGTAFAPPSVLSQIKPDASQDKDLHEKFTGEAYARLRDPQDSKLEIVVVVRWTEGKRARSLVLTSFLPRRRVEGTA